MDEAQRNEFTVRRVEFVGLTYTRDHVLRDRMTPIINEGDPFTHQKLVRSLRSMSTLKRAIYPLRLASVVIHLGRSEGGFVDMTICFRQRPRQVVANHRRRTHRWTGVPRRLDVSQLDYPLATASGSVPDVIAACDTERRH